MVQSAVPQVLLETKQSSSVSDTVLFSVPLRYRYILLSVTKASICRRSLCCLLLCDTFLTSKHYHLSVLNDHML